MATLWTIGYEAHQPLSLLAELQAGGGQRVVDVRIRPQSSRPGSSLTKLGGLLADHGIAYESRRTLGTPPEIKVHFRAGRTAQARTEFREYIEAAGGDELDDLAEELDSGQRTALRCLEANPAECHRRVIAEALVA